MRPRHFAGYRPHARAKGRRSHPDKALEPVRWPILSLAWWFSVTPGLRPSPPYARKPTGRSPPPPDNTHVIRGTCWTQCLLPSRRAGRERGEGREQCVADSHVRLARWLPVGRGGGHTEAGVRVGHSRPPLRRVPTGRQPSSLRPARTTPTSLMWGPRRSSGVRSCGGTRTPKSTKKNKTETKPNPKTPNCPRSFFFGLNINGRCLLFLKKRKTKKFLCIQKVLRKVVNSYKNRPSARRVK